MKESAKEVQFDETNQQAIQTLPKNEITKPIIVKQDLFFKRIYNAIDEESTQNAYEFAWISFDLLEISFRELKECSIKGIKDNDFDGLFFYFKNFSFLFMVILTLFNLILSFTSKMKILFQFSKSIIILLSIAIICIFLEGFFVNINQIKWGFYCFIVVNIMIFNLSKRMLNPQMP